MNSADENLYRLAAEQSEINTATTLIDQQVTGLISEIQTLEAKRVNAEQLLSRLEEDISAQKSRIDTAKLQIENLDKDIIPSVGNEIKSIQSQISLLQEEMETEPSVSLTDEEQTLLNQLKIIQTELDSDIEIHMRTLDEISIERQRLLSLLNDNLLRRKDELQMNLFPGECGQQTSMPVSLAAAQSEWRVKLDDNERRLRATCEHLEGIQARLQDEKEEEGVLRADIISSKTRLDQLKAADAKCKIELENAQENDEKLMTKVCRPSGIF